MNQTFDAPIAILIFENNGNYSYRAFSPTEYSVPLGDFDSRDDFFGRFIANIYNKIAYDNSQPLNNQTNFGRLKEVHSRFIQYPLELRSNVCYFSTYEHQHCQYRPIHRNSPINFNQNNAVNYENQQPNLGHHSCSHEFV